jgi:2-methylisocitrate lyase-like PEP mutase family enzyme
MTAFETFLQLHHGENPLLIGNVWDVSSALVFERNGFRAIATSSSAIARSLGYEDGENIPFDLLLQTVERIVRNIHIPLSVDIESGYGSNTKEIIQNIEALHDLGVVGFNLEDSSKTEKGKLQPAEDFQRNLSAITNHLDRKNMKMFVNARTDAFLLGLPSPLSESIMRIKIYEMTGVSGIFVPAITGKNDIGEVVKSTKLPVNVLVPASVTTLQRAA